MKINRISYFSLFGVETTSLNNKTIEVGETFLRTHFHKTLYPNKENVFLSPREILNGLRISKRISTI